MIQKPQSPRRSTAAVTPLILILSVTIAVLALAVIVLAVALRLASHSGGNDPSAESASLPVVNHLGVTETLTPGDYPWQLAEDPLTHRYGYNVLVSEQEGQLAVIGNVYSGLLSTPKTAAGTRYRVGSCIGSPDGVFLDDRQITSEACVGMVCSYNGQHLLVLTTDGENSTVRFASRPDETAPWQWDDEHTLPLSGTIRFVYYNWPSLNHAAPEDMYIITDTSFCRLSVGSYLNDPQPTPASIRTTSHTVPDYWKHLAPSGMVRIDGILYIGDMFGVVKFDPQTAAFTYYPLKITTPCGGSAA